MKGASGSIRLDNKDLIPVLERRIRARAAMMDPANRILMDKD